MKKIYVLNIEHCLHEEEHYRVKLFKSKEKAKKTLKELRDDFYEETSLDTYVIKTDTDDELDIYKERNYNEDKLHLYITEQDLL